MFGSLSDAAFVGENVYSGSVLAIDFNYGVNPPAVQRTLNANIVSNTVDISNVHWRRLYATRCPNLIYLFAVSCNLSYISILNCPNIDYLYCDINNLTSLDLSYSKITTLSVLLCHHNQLQVLTLGSCLVQDQLECHNNQLTSLDLHTQTSLIYLNCSTNPLASLNVHTASALTNLNVRDCSALRILDAYGTALDQNMIDIVYGDLLYNAITYNLRGNGNVDLRVANASVTPSATGIGYRNTLTSTSYLWTCIDNDNF